MFSGFEQVITSEGPLFCLSWCKRKRWLLVGGNARLHIYNVSPCLMFWMVVTAARKHLQLQAWPEALLLACTGLPSFGLASSCC